MTMFTRHVSERLAAHLDGLRQRERWRSERGQVRVGMKCLENLKGVRGTKV